MPLYEESYTHFTDGDVSFLFPMRRRRITLVIARGGVPAADDGGLS
jgi:hypothetical protein